MNTTAPRSPAEVAYEKAYQEAVREGAKGMSDLEIAIAEKMADMGFVKPDPIEPDNIPD